MLSYVKGTKSCRNEVTRLGKFSIDCLLGSCGGSVGGGAMAMPSSWPPSIGRALRREAKKNQSKKVKTRREKEENQKNAIKNTTKKIINTTRLPSRIRNSLRIELNVCLL